jgi:hypothetical protein
LQRLSLERHRDQLRAEHAAAVAALTADRDAIAQQLRVTEAAAVATQEELARVEQGLQVWHELRKI